MMSYLLVLGIAAFQGISSALKKKYVENMAHIKSSLELYVFLTYPLAAVYFLVLGKGEVPLNAPTFWFSFAFAAVCLCSNLFGMLAYRYTSLVYITVFTGAGTTVVPFTFELIFSGESFTVFEILSVILRLAAICVPIFKGEKETKQTATGILLCMVLFMTGGLVNIISKLYAQHPNVYSDSSFCFWTNIFAIPFMFAEVLKQSDVGTLLREGRQMKAKDYLFAIGSMLIGNLATLLGIQVLRMMSVTVYSVLSASLNMILTSLLSVFLFREKLTKEAVWSIVLSMLAIFLGVF